MNKQVNQRSSRILDFIYLEQLGPGPQTQSRKLVTKTKIESIYKAIKIIDKALQTAPCDPEAWYQKGLCLQQLGNQKEADACFTKSEQYTLQTTFDFYNLK